MKWYILLLKESVAMKARRVLLKEFRNRWKKIKIFEKKEAQKLSIKQKIWQLESLMRIGMGLGMDFREDKEKLAVRSRWVFLKKDLP